MSTFAGIPRDYPLSLQSDNIFQGNNAISHNQNIFLFKDNCFCTQVVLLIKLAHIRNELSWEFNVGIITPLELVLSNGFLSQISFVSFLINFSHVKTEPWLPGYKYFFRSKCVLLKDTTWHPK